MILKQKAYDDQRRYLDIFLDGLYDIASVRVRHPQSVVFYHQVYASPNGDAYTKIAYKSDGIPAEPEGVMHDVSATSGACGVSQIRVLISFAQEEIAVSKLEVKLSGKKVSGNIPQRAVCDMPVFETTIWAERFAHFNNDMGYAQQRVLSELSGLVGRVLGDKWVDSFVFEISDVSENGRDAFNIRSLNGKIVISGPNGVSLASGLNAYLKKYAHVNYNPLFGSNLNMPDTLPPVTAPITKQTNYCVRYALNFCTFSYTMAFWGWAQFERYLDWAAMNGVNLMLQIVGQEEVLYRFLSNYGYSMDDVLDYICGPGYFAWFYMQNLTSWGGPLPQSWLAARTELGRKIHDRMQALGIKPVLQGFSGMVPNNFREMANKNKGLRPGDKGYLPKYPDENDPRNSIAPQGKWCGYKRPDMIRTTSESGDFFEEAAALFYAAQANVFGNVSSYYAVDPFHEGGNLQGMNRSQVYKRVQSAMVKADSNAIWVIQQWGGNVSLETLHLMDKNHVLVLDLNSELRPEYEVMEQAGVPWIWNMLHNFGGRMGLFGDLPIVCMLPETLCQANHITGIGTTMEAYNNSGIMYDLLADMTWEDTPIDINEYLYSYVRSRYGNFDNGPEPNALAGWQIIAKTALSKKTIYVQGPPESVINSCPTADFVSASTWGHSTYQYDPSELEAALPYFIAAYNNLNNQPSFIYDFTELTAQVLSTFALKTYKHMMAATLNIEEFNRISAVFLNAVRMMDDIAAINPMFGVGAWIQSARTMLPEMDDWSKDLFEFNARALLTTWGGHENTMLVDYSNRQWAGLTMDLYLPRWEQFVNAYRKALASGGPVITPTKTEFFYMAWEWVNRKSDEGHCYPVEGSGADLSLLARKVEAALSQFD